MTNSLCPALAVVGFATLVSAAQLSTSDQAADDAYRAAIASAEIGTASRAVEAAFEVLARVREPFVRVPDGQIATTLEFLPDAEFTRLRRELKGRADPARRNPAGHQRREGDDKPYLAPIRH